LTSSSGCTKSLKSNIQKKKQEFEKNQCLECNWLFLLTANMEHHRKIHSCSECAYSTTEIAALKVYMIRHSKVASIYCSECNKPFSSQYALKLHLPVHMGEKPFLCSKCPQSFAQITSLKHHMRAHTGERPFLCIKCAKSFIKLANLVAQKNI